MHAVRSPAFIYRFGMIGLGLLIVSTLTACTSMGSCWIPEKLAEDYEILALPESAGIGELYFVEGVYQAGAGFSILDIGARLDLEESPLFTLFDYCVRIEDSCREVLRKRADLPGDFIDIYSRYGYIRAIARYAGDFNQSDCLLGRIEIVHLVSVRRANRKQMDDLLSELEVR